MKYRHLFFDLDHTLWDFEANAQNTLEEIYLNRNLLLMGVPDFNAFHSSYIEHNNRLWERYHRGFIKSDELRWKRMWHTLLDFKIGSEQLAKEISNDFLEMLPSRTALFPYTLEILNYLKNKGYSLHLITNGFEEVQYSKLKYSNLTHYFDHIITSEGSNSVKPNKEIFDYALHKAGADLSNSIMLGDNLEADIQGAMNAGLDQVFVNHLQVPIDIRPTYIIHHLKELENIF